MQYSCLQHAGNATADNLQVVQNAVVAYKPYTCLNTVEEYKQYRQYKMQLSHTSRTLVWIRLRNTSNTGSTKCSCPIQAVHLFEYGWRIQATKCSCRIQAVHLFEYGSGIQAIQLFVVYKQYSSSIQTVQLFATCRQYSCLPYTMSTMCGMHAVQLFDVYNEYNVWHACNTVVCRIQWVQCVTCMQYSCLQNTVGTVCGRKTIWLLAAYNEYSLYMHVRQLLAAYNEYSSWHADNTIACSTQWVQFMACRQYRCLLNTYVTIGQLVIVTLFCECAVFFLEIG